MADSGVDTSNESSDNPVFPRVSLELEPAAVPLPPVPDGAGVSVAPDESAEEPHEYVGKMRHTKHRRRLVACNHVPSMQRLRLARAASTNNAEVVQQLLDAGADPNAPDDHLRSPLHLAACRGFVDVVRALLRHGANPNVRDSLGNTPLHLAACTSHLPVVSELLAAGADECSNDAHGRTPLDLAHSKLRLIQQRPSAGHPAEMSQLIAEVRSVLDMMLTYLRRQVLSEEDAGIELESVCARLEKVSTREEVQSEVQCLLNSLDNLKLR